MRKTMNHKSIHLFWQGLKEWGVKETRGNAVDPDSLAGKVPAQRCQQKESIQNVPVELYQRRYFVHASSASQALSLAGL